MDASRRRMYVAFIEREIDRRQVAQLLRSL